jgi:hypothetical protein
MDSDWTGSQKQRRQPDVGIVAGPPATKTLYVVEAGTPALAKRVGLKTFGGIVTKRRWEFDKPYAQSAKSLTFFINGYLLCIYRNRVKQVTVDASNRFHAAREPQAELQPVKF